MYAAHNPDVEGRGRVVRPRRARAYAPGDKPPLDVVAQIKAPVLGLYGGADAGIPNDTVEKIFAALEGGRQRAVGDRRSIPDTPHAFHADYRPTLSQGQRPRTGGSALLAWFKQYWSIR